AAKKKLDETNKIIDENRYRAQELSNKIITKEQEYNDQHGEYTRITEDVQQRQTAKATLDGNIQNLNNKWTSAIMCRKNATEEVTDLRDKVANIKLRRRNEVQTKIQRQKEQENFRNNSRTVNNVQEKRYMTQRKLTTMSDYVDMIEEVIYEIKNGKTLTNDRIEEFADDLLYDESSNDACRVFLALGEKKLFISDLVFERLCNIIIDNHQQITKENSIRTIDILIENGRNPSYLCLKTLSIALQNQQNPTLRRYGSKILYNLIKTHSTLRLNPSLLNAMSHALNDSLTTVQSYMLYSFEEIVRNQRYDIPQQSIDNMEVLLSNMYQDINKNYGKCGLMASFFLNLLYRQYKLNENLLEIFSELLIVEIVNHKDLSLNRSASYVLQKAIENQLFIGHLTPKILNNISTCFNSISSQHKEMLEYCLKILCALNEDQLISTRLDIKLLKYYLTDTNFE
ncbi:unnamed protein product, partial [Didymodactylos carnosus]